MIVMPTTPIRNAKVGMVYQHVHFSGEECDRIVASAKEEAWQQGGVGGHGEADGAVVTAARSCLEQRLPFDARTGHPLSTLAYTIANINSETWRFDLSGFVSDDMPYLMRYSGTNKDHNDWHTDMGRGYTASRKLSFSLQLSAPEDYEGGDLEFLNMPFDRAELRRKGALVVFPPYWSHKVHPVVAGTRHVVVGWVHGPSFR